MDITICYAMFIARHNNTRFPEFAGVALSLETAKELCSVGQSLEWEDDTRVMGRWYSELKPHSDYFIIQEVQSNALQIDVMRGA